MDDPIDYFQPLAEKLALYLDEAAVAQVYQAYLFAERAHTGQKRRTGEDYITHPIAAAIILADLKLEHEAIMATLLHDVIEDTAQTKDDIKALFGEQVADLVDGVSKLTQIKFSSRAEAQAENFRKMLMAMVRDIRVMIVKLADRLHNMRTLGVMPHEKKRRIAHETLEIYAPIAHRLGIHPFFTELEDLGFKALYPLRYRVIEHAVMQTKKKRQQTTDLIIEQFSETLKVRGVTDFKLYNRHRHLFSIYRKIKARTTSFSEIMDMYAFRIVVDQIDDCYRALGATHQVFKPRPDRFRDYISIPKANGYQALHTTLFGPDGSPIDVQIRTKEMEDMAEHGIAAHWIHTKNHLHNPTQSRTKRWIKYLLEIQKNSSSSVEFIETVKSDLFPKEVYVFTPDGDILELPRNATAVDFAYAVHSDLGNSCVAVKIDRKLSPLSYKIKNGQTIEIITANGATPNPAWLDSVVTGKARTNIKHFLKNQQREQSHQLGYRILENLLKTLGYALENFSQQRLQSAADELNMASFEDIYERLGLGKIMPLVVIDTLLPDISKQRRTDDGFEKAPAVSSLVLDGTEGMIIKFAECCYPIPGDAIVGCQQKERGIYVHAERCTNVKVFRNDPARYMSLRWGKVIQGEFKVAIHIEVTNRRGVLGMLATAIADEAANIVNITVDQGDGNHSTVKLIIGVKDCKQLDSIRHRLQLLPVVNRVHRVS